MPPVGDKKRGFKQEPSRKDQSWWKRLWDWTEFGKKTGWQWLALLSALAIPVILAIAGYWFTGQQTESQQAFEAQQRALEEQRAEAERELAEQRAQDEAMQFGSAYIVALTAARKGPLQRTFLVAGFSLV
jgi:hypothetical protein